MLFSERQISIAASLAQFGLNYELILKAVMLDRINEKKDEPIQKYLEALELNKPTDQ